MGRSFSVFALLMLTVGEVCMLPESLKQIASNFLKEVEFCKSELGIKDSMFSELYHLWKEEYDSVTRDTGCLLNCISKKLDIFNIDGKLHHEDAKEFAKNNGADDHVATELVKLVHDCEKNLGEMSDECVRTLELTKCVRRNIIQVKWTPKTEILVGEIIGHE